MTALKTQPKLTVKTWLWIVASALVTAALVLGGLRYMAILTVDDFESCKRAGGIVMESFPEQCAINGKTFHNERQVIAL